MEDTQWLTISDRIEIDFLQKLFEDKQLRTLLEVRLARLSSAVINPWVTLAFQLYDRINSDEIRPSNPPQSTLTHAVWDVITTIEQESHQQISSTADDLLQILLEPHLQVRRSLPSKEVKVDHGVVSAIVDSNRLLRAQIEIRSPAAFLRLSTRLVTHWTESDSIDFFISAERKSFVAS